MTSSAGIIVLTDMPDFGGRISVLQARGLFNHETLRAETWPGLCQPLAHGGAEEGEEVKENLIWELGEEIGVEAVKYVRRYWKNLIQLTNSTAGDENIQNYGIVLPREFIPKIVLSASSGGLRFISESQLKDVIPVSSGVKKMTGMTDMTKIAMFDDDLKALKIAFEKLVAL